MLEYLYTAALVGLEVVAVRVEVSIRRGTPMIRILGLPAGEACQVTERIRAVASFLDLHVPGLRITVNLAPADVRKHGSGFDLPIFMGILAAAGRLDMDGERLRGFAMVGELGLDGSVRGIRGALAIALHFADSSGPPTLIVPRPNLREARLADGLDVRGVGDVSDVLDLVRGRPSVRANTASVDTPPARDPSEPASTGAVDLADVCGQETAKRALEVAAAGGHNMLLRGPPGSGKTMLARRLATILPPMTRGEALEATVVHSVAGRLPADSGLLERRPFRAPHHAVSAAGLVGGGVFPRPGEVSLAHCGVLFLDELPEFRAGALEALRQPLEDRRVTIVRAQASVTFPARFQLVAAMNPCPCGAAGGSSACECHPGRIRRYMGRVSGPLLDRIDIQVDVPATKWRELTKQRRPETSASVRSRVQEVRARAARRLGAADRYNAQLCLPELRTYCVLDVVGEELLRTAVERLGLSARAYHRILRLARTIADLAGADRIAAGHVAEAVQYRTLDRSREPSAVDA